MPLLQGLLGFSYPRILERTLFVFTVMSGFLVNGNKRTCLAASTSSSPWANAWVTDGDVYSIVPSTTVTYLSGGFTYVGPRNGAGVPINTSDGSATSPFPAILGNVYAVVHDGSGGWFVGGGFRHRRKLFSFQYCEDTFGWQRVVF